MKLFPSETFLVYKTKLVGDVVFLMYWDLDNNGRPDCVGQFIRIGSMDILPLKTPLILIRPPIINGIYDKREFSLFLGEEVEKKRLYLDRMGQKLQKQLEAIIITGYPYYDGSIDTQKDSDNTSEALKKFLFLMAYLFGGNGTDGGEEEKKRPP